ncbi:cell division protein FtsQ/DivIB [Thermophagus sp. OGC60D27]|uniref:cell division protein FtsQ/DivIB n=1 Tax=Thermophagus sp. OGC60D27 TaxID=3458415 RepID=UPI004037637D
MKNVKKSLLWGLLLLYFPVMLGLVGRHHQKLVCSEVEVNVLDSLKNGFVQPHEIKNAVLGKFDGILGEPINALKLNEIETFVEKHPAVYNCEVYNTIEGILKIDLIQHKPLFRVFEKGRSYYIDEYGNEMQLFDNYTARVMIVSGVIEGQLDHLIYLARLFRKDLFWTAQIEQVYIKKNGDYVLVPRVGDHLILLGPPERIDEKMRNLKALYKQGLSPREWNKYKVINLKYKGQVLCSKNRNL